MTWININIPGLTTVTTASGYFLGNVVRGYFAGAKAEVVETLFTDREILRFQDTANILRSCEPWENHIKDEVYNPLNKLLKTKPNDYQTARDLITEFQVETAAPWCISALKMALVDVCTKCTTSLREALPKKIIIPK